MAKRIKSYTHRYRNLGKRHLRLFCQILVALLLAFQPALGGGGGSGGSGGGCGSGGSGSGGGGGGGGHMNVSSEVSEDYSSSTAADIAATGLVEGIDRDDYIAGLLGSASNRNDPRLPGYSYFQGVIQAQNHITIAGQVRIVGAVLGVEDPGATANLYNGAMVTSNAHAVTGAGLSLTGGPPGMRTRIKSLEEIPNP